MIVMKFGGTSVGKAGMIRDVAKIVSSQARRKPVIVVSAFSGVTDKLITAAKNTVKGGPDKRGIEELIERHYAVIKELGLGIEIINKEIKELERLLYEISVQKEISPRMLDNIMSFGERISARVVADYFSSIGLKSTAYDAYDLGLSTDSKFGCASPLPETYSSIKEKFKGVSGIPVITGFIGKDKKGEITTLGRGGSDYTAAIFGAAIEAEEVQVWTDVDGIMTADPKIVNDARRVDRITFQEEDTIAVLSGKVVHPMTFFPAMKKNINVRILNTLNPRHSGTLVVKDVVADGRIVSIVCKKGVSIVNVRGSDELLNSASIRKVFEVLDNNDISTDMVSASEVGIALVVDGGKDIDRLASQLSGIGREDVERRMAKISLVGKRLLLIPNVLEKAFSALGNINVLVFSSGTSDLNQDFVVREDDAERAVRLLHKKFFGG